MLKLYEYRINPAKHAIEVTANNWKFLKEFFPLPRFTIQFLNVKEGCSAYGWNSDYDEVDPSETAYTYVSISYMENKSWVRLHLEIGDFIITNGFNDIEKTMNSKRFNTLFDVENAKEIK